MTQETNFEEVLKQELGKDEFETFMQVAETAFALGYLRRNQWDKSMLKDLGDGKMTQHWNACKPFFFETIVEKIKNLKPTSATNH